MPERRQPATSLTPGQQGEFEQIVAKFERAWFRGERPEIETCLPSDPALRRAVLLELIQIDIEFRSKAGEAAQPQAYLSRFPEVRSDLAAVQSIIAAVGKVAARQPAANASAAVPGLKPEPPPPRRESQRTRGPTVNPDQGIPKETAAISSSEISEDTHGGTAMEQEAGIRLYAALKRGVTLGNYVILDKLGEGGMGTVFRAEHRRMLREVALKVLSPEVLKAPQAVQRFHREVRVAAKLTHPNIVTAYDADEEQGVHFLVMEIVEGTNLSSLVKRDGPLPVKKAVDFVVQAARGLDYAHSKGIVHRDVKPGNLMLDQFGVVKILDLGLARLDESAVAADADITDTGNVMGTIDYLAPEQAVNTKHADQRSDIYSLGCTLWFLLAGKALYGGQTPVERILAHRDRAIPSLRHVRNDISMELEAVFREMVAKSPDERYQSMSDVLRAFEKCHLGGNDTAASGYMLVAPLADDIPLADKSFALGQAVAPPTPAPTFTPAPGRETGPKLGTRSKTGPGRKTVKPPSPAKTAADPEASLGLSRKAVTAAVIGAGVVFVAVVIGVVLWAMNRGPPAAVVAENKLKPDKPAPVVAPFSADAARRQQALWQEFLGEPTEKRNSIGMQLVLIPAGEFEMGTPDGELVELLAAPASPMTQSEYRSESPTRHVTIDAPFYMGADEVTQAEYEQVMGVNPSWFSKAGEGSEQVGVTDTRRHPVERVSWIDAVEFCNRLSDREHLNQCYLVQNGRVTDFVAANGYRLPGEAEWEFASRAGSSGKYALPELEAAAWHDARSGGMTCRAGTTSGNAFGLFEMHGNVWEWCHNEHRELRPDRIVGRPASGPLAPDAERVVRGGSWNDGAVDCRSAVRSGRVPTFRTATVGFRVVVSLPERGI